MRQFEITGVDRHQGEGQEEFDNSRIGKHVYTEGFEVGKPAFLHHRDVEGRVMITSPVVGYTDLNDGIELRTRNTTYTLRELFVH